MGTWLAAAIWTCISSGSSISRVHTSAAMQTSTFSRWLSSGIDHVASPICTAISPKVGSIAKTGAFASLSDGMRMLALLELEFGSGLFNRSTELRWKSEGLHDREIEKLFGKQPCEGNQHNRLLARRIARSWLFGIQRLFHNLGNNIRGASCFFVLGKHGRHSAKTYGIQTGSFRRQRSDLLFDRSEEHTSELQS